MTKAHSSPGDNGGRCESCDDPATIYQAQTAVPVRLGGGMGMGTMWKCRKCAGTQAADYRSPEPAAPAERRSSSVSKATVSHEMDAAARRFAERLHGRDDQLPSDIMDDWDRETTKIALEHLIACRLMPCPPRELLDRVKEALAAASVPVETDGPTIDQACALDMSVHSIKIVLADWVLAAMDGVG